MRPVPVTDIASPTGLYPKAMDAIETFTGKAVRPTAIHTGDVDIRDIAHHLSQQSRHGGACLVYLSVAQHCVMVYDWLAKGGHHPAVCYAGLLHDAEEAYLRDIPRPIKHLDWMRPYRDLSERVRDVCWNALGVYRALSDAEINLDAAGKAIKVADDLLVMAEIHQWKRSRGENLPPFTGPKEPVIVPWETCEEAEERFLERFRRSVT